MKKLLLGFAFAFSIASFFTSCNNGAYDANPNTNNSGTSVPNNGGGGSGSNNAFDWTGTDPMTAKIDSVAFQATTGKATSSTGMIIQALNGSTSIQIGIVDAIAEGKVYSFSSNNLLMLMEGTDLYTNTSGGSGSVKIIENDATHIKGLFYGTVKSTSGVTKTISSGYFNVLK